MSRYCCVCKAIEIPWDKSRRFHTFSRNDEARKKWLAAIGRESVPKKAYLCSDHFLDSCYRPNDEFYPTDRRLLKPDAVPTIVLSDAASSPESCVIEATDSRNSDVGEKAPIITDNSIIITSTCDTSNLSVPGPKPTFNNTHEFDATKRRYTSFNSSCDEVGNENMDILRRASIFRRKMPVDDQETPPIKMLSRTTHNIDTMRVGLKRKEKMDEMDALPTRIRFMDGDQVIELSQRECTSQEAFRKVLIMKKVFERQVKAIQKRLNRRDRKIPELHGLVKKLGEEKEFAAANFLKVPD
ncbi:hypothetical protein QAD02_021438 [Eretmocerus hayati]|uniref:Uncharacterized protein n=1 Tax=Eretmocerus hayati TaxID=131215 RepID=A0ACC2PPX6_9HYME|nr:hypothetical protein QAD02_021438 [Eretmocerus hayati]